MHLHWNKQKDMNRQTSKNQNKTGRRNKEKKQTKNSKKNKSSKTILIEKKCYGVFIIPYVLKTRHTNKTNKTKTNKNDKQNAKYIILIHFIYISSTHFAMYSYLSGYVSIFLCISSKNISYKRRRKSYRSPLKITI